GRDRDGHGDRRRDAERRRDARARRSARDRAREALEPRDDAQYPSEPVLRVRVQRARRAGCGRSALPGVRDTAVSDLRGRGDERELGLRDRERIAAPTRADLTPPEIGIQKSGSDPYFQKSAEIGVRPTAVPQAAVKKA